ncbi:MAG: zinc-ribbon domain-containing protein [Candidatus Doudnabacteria bacterium]
MLFPDLVKEWDYKKNKPGPDKVKPSSQLRVWWKCKKGHGWTQAIASRVYGNKYRMSDCPTCGSLYYEDKQLLDEWDYKKNKPLSPKNVRAASNKKVWWKCKKGHQWEATIGNRFRGSGCPKCNIANSSSKLEIRVLSELRSIFENVEHRKKINGIEVDIFIPTLQIAIEVDGVYWHKSHIKSDLTKNKAMDDVGIPLYRIREKGLTPLSNRDVVLKTKTLKHSDIVLLLEKIDQQNTLPHGYFNYKKLKGWKNDPEYQTLIKLFPDPLPEKSLSYKYPDISKQWHKRNLPLTPKQFSFGSHEKVWWRCKKGHEWQAGIKDRTLGGQGCPFCSGNKVSVSNRLSSKFPTLIKKEWDFKKNSTKPEEIGYGSNKKVWWRCKKGHSYEMAVKGKTIQEHGCPICAGKITIADSSFKVKFPQKSKLWDFSKNKGLSPEQIAPFSNKKVWWRCKEGHQWEARVAKISLGQGCPTCYKIKRSKNK